MRADNEKPVEADAVIADLGSASERTLGDFMPNAWESPLLKDRFDP